MKKEPYIPTQTEWVRQFGKPSLILPIKGLWLRKIWSGENKKNTVRTSRIISGCWKNTGVSRLSRLSSGRVIAKNLRWQSVSAN